MWIFTKLPYHVRRKSFKMSLLRDHFVNYKIARFSKKENPYKGFRGFE